MGWDREPSLRKESTAVMPSWPSPTAGDVKAIWSKWKHAGGWSRWRTLDPLPGQGRHPSLGCERGTQKGDLASEMLCLCSQNTKWSCFCPSFLLLNWTKQKTDMNSCKTLSENSAVILVVFQWLHWFTHTFPIIMSNLTIIVIIVWEPVQRSAANT